MDDLECPLDEAGLEELQARCPPLTLEEPRATHIDGYRQCLAVVHEIVSRYT